MLNEWLFKQEFKVAVITYGKILLHNECRHIILTNKPAVTPRCTVIISALQLITKYVKH